MDPAHYFCLEVIDTTGSGQVATIQHSCLSTDTPDPMFVPALEAKRMAISARRTGPLHDSGLKEVMDKVRLKKMSDPTLYGFTKHYNRIGCWGAERSAKGQQVGLGEALSYVTPTEDLGSSKLSHCLTIHDYSTELSKQTPVLALPKLDFSKYTFATRTDDKDLWPRPNPKAITSRKSLAELMMTRHVSSLLAQEGLIPVIVSPNPLDPTQSIQSPFGPMLDSHFQPCKYGQRFLAATIYNKYRLKKGQGFNDAWHPDVWVASACVFRLPEKMDCHRTSLFYLVCHLWAR